MDSRSIRRLLPLLCLSGQALAGTLYKCSGDSGIPTYTNSREGYRNCTVVSSSPAPAAATATPRGKGSASAPTPADFPKVSGDAQKSRDNDRRHILEQEVATEQKGLEEARRTLGEQEAARAPGDRLQALKDQVALHNRNLDALRRELDRLK